MKNTIKNKYGIIIIILFAIMLVLFYYVFFDNYTYTQQSNIILNEVKLEIRNSYQPKNGIAMPADVSNILERYISKGITCKNALYILGMYFPKNNINLVDDKIGVLEPFDRYPFSPELDVNIVCLGGIVKDISAIVYFRYL